MYFDQIQPWLTNKNFLKMSPSAARDRMCYRKFLFS